MPLSEGVERFWGGDGAVAGAARFGGIRWFECRFRQVVGGLLVKGAVRRAGFTGNRVSSGGVGVG